MIVDHLIGDFDINAPGVLPVVDPDSNAKELLI